MSLQQPDSNTQRGRRFALTAAAAEANNVIIGRIWLDADLARAGDALGLSKADRVKLRDLGQGEFYAFGPALGKPGVVYFRIADASILPRVTYRQHDGAMRRDRRTCRRDSARGNSDATLLQHGFEKVSPKVLPAQVSRRLFAHDLNKLV
ncbi:MAG: hypothetical protein JO121_08210 [Deltaproteobacteria bacterium]|nr:hypothetical protein [Deltaproteobacteria bacterium]